MPLILVTKNTKRLPATQPLTIFPRLHLPSPWGLNLHKIRTTSPPCKYEIVRINKKIFFFIYLPVEHPTNVERMAELIASTSPSLEIVSCNN